MSLQFHISSPSFLKISTLHLKPGDAHLQVQKWSISPLPEKNRGQIVVQMWTQQSVSADQTRVLKNTVPEPINKLPGQKNKPALIQRI